MTNINKEPGVVVPRVVKEAMKKSAKETLWNHHLWMRRNQFRLLLEDFLLNKICRFDFSISYYVLMEEINKLVPFYISFDELEKELKSLNVNPGAADLALHFQELLFLGETSSYSLEEEEEELTGTYGLTMYKNRARSLYEHLLFTYKEENVFLKNVLDERILQETILFFTIVSGLTYVILKPGFIEF